jgi:hypothetical protein
MTTSHLYCIFNANDPTPTAIAIRSLNFQSVTVYVIGHDSFSEPQRKNLDLLKRWATGSGKEGHWPDGLWDSDWDWPEVESDVTFQLINGIDSDIFGEVQADHFFFDLKGGTKAMSIELMDAANQVFDSPEFIFSNLGESLLLSKGVVLPRGVLALRELTYLASGYVMNPSFVPLREDALAIQTHFSFTQETKKSSETKEIFEVARFSKAFFKSIGKEVPADKSSRNLMEQHFLEDFATSVLSLSENVVEAVGGVRFLDPSFKNSKGAAKWLLGKPYIKKKLEKKGLHKPCMALLTSSASEEENEKRGGAIGAVRNYLHIMEIDVLAILSTGELIGIECKYGRYDHEDVHRIRSICQRLSMRAIPVLVHSKLTSSNPYGVAELSFTEMGNAVELIRLLNTRTLLTSPGIEKAASVSPPSKNKNKTKEIGNEHLAPVNKERNALHCLPLIEIAVVSISSTGGNYSTFKRGMKRLQISMENMDIALAELGQKMGFKTTNKPDTNWIEWDVEDPIELNSADKVINNSESVSHPSDGKVDFHTAIGSLLLLVKSSPRSWSEFLVELRNSGFNVKGLRQLIIKNFADELKFEVVPGDKLVDSGDDWIIWN